jgi:hypothetical protein
MAAALLSIFTLTGCPTGGGPGPVITPLTPGPVPTVTAVTVAGDLVVIKGADEVTKQYTATVAGTNSPSQTVTWSIDGGAPAGVSISSAGVLTVKPAAATGSITIKAASTVAGYTDKYGTKGVTINDATSPTVTSVTIVTGAGSITKSASSNVTETYTADVAGTNSPSQTVTWSVEGNPTYVSISSAGVLTVEPTASTGTITIRATSTVAGYTDKYGTKSVTINAPPSETDFTTEANAELLGLYPGDNYANGAALIAAMDGRINSSFYNITTYGLPVDPSNVYGATGVKADNVAGAAPAMAWAIHNDTLIVYGYAGEATIVFNVAVIKESDGTGWINGDGNNDPYGNTYLRMYNTRAEQIPISDLTDSNITTTAGLSGYKVYVIVRWTDDFISNRDFNKDDDFYNNMNVISVTVP